MDLELERGLAGKIEEEVNLDVSLDEDEGFDRDDDGMGLDLVTGDVCLDVGVMTGRDEDDDVNLDINRDDDVDVDNLDLGVVNLDMSDLVLEECEEIISSSSSSDTNNAAGSPRVDLSSCFIRFFIGILLFS